MSLADALRTPPTRTSRPCALGHTIDSLTGADANAVELALADGRFTVEAIRLALRAAGHQMSASTVLRHRRGQCACV